MQRDLFCSQVKPDRLEEYKERHRAVWPEMLAPCAKPDGTTIRCSSVLTACSWDISKQMILNAPAQEWPGAKSMNAGRREMAGFFIQPDGALPDRAMEPLEEVFHL